MSNKAKGSRVERELIKLFTEHGWRAVRVAGSGVGEESPCDLLASKVGRGGCVVEVKSSKSSIIYISREQVHDFVMFAETIGLRAVIAVRFNGEGWLFLDPSELRETGKKWAVGIKDALAKGMRFSQYFEED